MVHVLTGVDDMGRNDGGHHDRSWRNMAEAGPAGALGMAKGGARRVLVGVDGAVSVHFRVGAQQ